MCLLYSCKIIRMIPVDSPSVGGPESPQLIYFFYTTDKSEIEMMQINLPKYFLGCIKMA